MANLIVTGSAQAATPVTRRDGSLCRVEPWFPLLPSPYFQDRLSQAEAFVIL
jgi:hypothetical protein